jgi:hypothetical protein
MGKHSNEKNAQQTREDGVAGASETNEETPTGTFQHGSEQVLQSRRIAKRINGQYKSPSSTSAPSSSNPFVSVSFSSSNPTPSPNNAFSNVMQQQLEQPPPPPVPPDDQGGRLPELIQAFHGHIQGCRQNKMGVQIGPGRCNSTKSFIVSSRRPPVAVQAAASPVAAPIVVVAPTCSTPSSGGAHLSSRSRCGQFASTLQLDPGLRDQSQGLQECSDSAFLAICDWHPFLGDSKILVLRNETTGSVLFNDTLPADVEYVMSKGKGKVTPRRSFSFSPRKKAEDSPFLMVRLNTTKEKLEPCTRL